ncbi:MAG: TRAP transporter small permease [Azospirillaceae bacterium]
MTGLWHVIDRGVDGLKRLLEASLILLTLSFFIVVLAAVFYRYVLNDSLVWTEEYVRFSLFWVILLGSALVSDDDAHLRIEVVHRYLPQRLSRIVGALANLAAIVFCAVLFYQALNLFLRTTGTSPALGFPMRWVYAAMLFGAPLIVIMTLRCWIAGRHRPVADPL